MYNHCKIKQGPLQYCSQYPEVGIISDHNEAEAKDPDAAQYGAGSGGGKLGEEGIG